MRLLDQNRQERTFQVQHSKAGPVAIVDGAGASGGGKLTCDNPAK